MTYLPLLKLGGANPITGVQLSMATRCSQGRQGKAGQRHCPVYEETECEELSLQNSHEQVESLRARIKDWGNKGNLVVGIYYRPPDQGEPTDETSTNTGWRMKGLSAALRRRAWGYWWMKSLTWATVCSQPSRPNASWAASKAAWPAGRGRW